MGCPRCGGRVRGYHSERLGESFVECTRCGWSPDDEVNEPACDVCFEPESACTCRACEYCGDKSQDEDFLTQTIYGMYCAPCKAELDKELSRREPERVSVPDFTDFATVVQLLGVIK